MLVRGNLEKCEPSRYKAKGQGRLPNEATFHSWDILSVYWTQRSRSALSTQLPLHATHVETSRVLNNPMYNLYETRSLWMVLKKVNRKMTTSVSVAITIEIATVE
jgi:hypothetical protein